MSLTMESSHVGLLQQNLSQEPSKSPSPQPTDSTPEQPNIDANLSAILNATKTNTVPMVKAERTPSPEQENKGFEKELEAQQKAFQRFTTSLNDLGFRPPFPINVLPPFLAALQQNPLTIHQQLLGMTAQQRSDVSPDLDDDDDPDNLGSTEPEDLTIGLRKDKKDANGDDNADSDISGQQNWSYEEQFKQLYELSDDVKRKEWLDDWLGFMHRIGKPVTRIPIMAKQVLDLYELYRLVVQHGGLVEIINKKLWREITKGLNLPSSITSAAFTLRTQYQKFLYDYECEKEGLSNPTDLQQAIDGNRREGRRSTSNDSGLGPSASQQAAFVAAYRAEQIAALQAHQRQLEKAQRAAVEAVSRQTFHASVSGRESTSSVDSDGTPVKRPRRLSESKNDAAEENSSGVVHEQSADRLFDAIPSAHLKITSRGGTNSTKSSLVVSMEINGIMYQGVLFALNPALQAVAQEDSASDPGDSGSIVNSLKITL